MTLYEYIVVTGRDACARLFDVSPHTVESWQKGVRQPRPEKAFEIERMTRGKVSFRECYEKSRAA